MQKPKPLGHIPESWCIRCCVSFSCQWSMPHLRLFFFLCSHLFLFLGADTSQSL
uniref:Uncharacterized protein n=1 Tax=Anguilla anguilla TaxID=7936 RepID=A0A0E9VTP7_ANGAN